MAAPEWLDTSRVTTAADSPSREPGDMADPQSSLQLGAPGLTFNPSADSHGSPVDCGTLVAAAQALAAECSAFFDPVLLGQLDAALAHVLADRAQLRATEADNLLRNALAEGPSLESVADLAGHAGATKTAAAKAATRAVAATTVLTALGGDVEAGAGFDPAMVERVDPGALIDAIAAAESAKSALCAMQAQAGVLLMSQQRLAQARAGMTTEKLGQGVGAQIGLARGESPHQGRRLCELADVLVREMPHTLHALNSGVLNEYRAGIMAKETLFLSPEDRARVDELICGDPDQLAGWGNRELGARARKAAYALEPEAFVRRLQKAETERYVSLRPAADGMTLLTALLPLRQGVRILATLTRIADTATATGDDRSKGQLMADTLIHRLTHHTPCTADSSHAAGKLAEVVARSCGAGDRLCTTVEDPDIVLELVMTDRALFDGANDPAVLVGYEPIPAPTARTWILGTTNNPASVSSTTGSKPTTGRSSPQVWLKRLFTHPDSNQLLAMDSRARSFPEGMKEFLRLQDQRCRTPWCDAPIRQYDHIKAYAAGGPTSISNGQGLCIACNQTKETPGWTTSPATGTGSGSGSGSGSTITTPTGHHYTSASPTLPGTPDHSPPV